MENPPNEQRKTLVGLAVMRLQPMHIGHWMLIRTMHKETDAQIIVITSAQAHGTLTNPLSCKSREAMLRKMANHHKFPQNTFLIHLIPDIGGCSDGDWIKCILAKINFDPLAANLVYYTASEIEALPWKNANIQTRCVENHPEYNGAVSGAIIRELFAQGNVSAWKFWVPLLLQNDVQQEMWGANMRKELQLTEKAIAEQPSIQITITPKITGKSPLFFCTPSLNVGTFVGLFLHEEKNTRFFPSGLCFLVQKGPRVLLNQSKSFAQNNITTNCSVHIISPSLIEFTHTFLDDYSDDIRYLISTKTIWVSQLILSIPKMDENEVPALLNVCSISAARANILAFGSTCRR